MKIERDSRAGLLVKIIYTDKRGNKDSHSLQNICQKCTQRHADGPDQHISRYIDFADLVFVEDFSGGWVSVENFRHANLLTHFDEPLPSIYSAVWKYHRIVLYQALRVMGVGYISRKLVQLR